MAEEQKTTNASATAAENQPVFRLQKLYVKDLSFENPNAPDVFFSKQNEPKVDINLGLRNKKLGNDNYEVSLAITAKITDTATDKALFIIEVEHAAAFLIKNIPDQHLPAVLAVECPTLIFPFTRQIISQTSVDGGFIPFLLEPVNFHALFESKKKMAAAENEKQN
jgi:preprotein translocase subunit SecB